MTDAIFAYSQTIRHYQIWSGDKGDAGDEPIDLDVVGEKKLGPLTVEVVDSVAVP